MSQGKSPRPASLLRIFLTIVALGLLSPCLCCAGLLLAGGELDDAPGWDGPPPPLTRREPRPPPPLPPAPELADRPSEAEPQPAGEEFVDLGVARFPERQPEAPWASYRWVAAALSPARYGVGYGLEERTARRLLDDFDDLAAAMQYRRLDEDRILFEAPEGCQRDLRCIYAELAREHEAAVRPLAARFLERGRAAGLSPPELAALILTFVQHLRYQLPEDQPFGLLPPAHVAHQGWGDCDSKALLAILLLRACGIEAAMLASQSLAHAAVGVRLPGRGLQLEWRGRRYLYTEVTAEGWPMGRVPPRYDVPASWEVVWAPD